MDLGVFYQVIVPLMEMRGTATIMISTPIGTFNFYTELTTLRDQHGAFVFNTIRMSAACRRCRGTEYEIECEHPSPDKPPWKLADTEKMKAMFAHRKSMLSREVFGKVADAESLAFEVRDLQAFFKAPPAREPHDVATTIFVAVDPNGGAGSETGTGSETAIVSFFFNGLNPVVRSCSLAFARVPRRRDDSLRRRGRRCGADFDR